MSIEETLCFASKLIPEWEDYESFLALLCEDPTNSTRVSPSESEKLCHWPLAQNSSFNIYVLCCYHICNICEIMIF